MILEMIRKDESVLWVLLMVRGGDGQQQRWWRMIPFASSTILPFDECLANFNRLKRKRSENDENWALRDVFWLRIEEDMSAKNRKIITIT